MTQQNVSMLEIDGKQFSVNDLNEAAKAQVVNLRVVEQEIARLQTQLAIHQTARNAYVAALKAQLPQG